MGQDVQTTVGIKDFLAFVAEAGHSLGNRIMLIHLAVIFLPLFEVIILWLLQVRYVCKTQVLQLELVTAYRFSEQTKYAHARLLALHSIRESFLR